MRASRTRRAAVLLLFGTAFVPLVYWTGVLHPAATGRAVFFRVLVQLAALSLLLLLALRGRGFSFRGDPFLWCFTAFVGVGLLTGLAGVAPGRSLFGTMERMWGVITWAHLLLFYILLRTLMDEEDWEKLFRISLVVSVAVCLAGLAGYHAEALGLPAFIGREPRILATLGNPGYVAVYAFLSFALAAWLWTRARTRSWKLVCLLAAGLHVWAYHLAGTRAVLVGAVGATVLLIGLAAGARLLERLRGAGGLRRGHILRRAGLALAGLTVLGAAAGTTLPDGDEALRAVPGVERARDWLVDSSTSVRLAAWDAALDGVGDRPLTGAGPENFSAVYNENFDPREYLATSRTRQYDRAHNTYLEVLVASGVPGLLVYLAMWAALLLGLHRGWRRGRLETGEALIFAWALLGYGIYLFFWFEDHSSTVLFVAMAAFIWHRARGVPLLELTDSGGRGGRLDRAPGSSRSGIFGLAFLVALPLSGLTLHQQGAEILRAAHAARSAQTAPDPWSAVDRYRRALDVGITQRAEVAVELSRHLVGLTGWLAVRVRDPAAAVSVEEALATGIAGMDRELERDSRNVQLLIQRSLLHRTVYRALGREADLRAARADLHRALEVGPRRIRLHHLLAELHLLEGDHDRALAVLDEASSIFDGFGETDFHRARVLFAMGRREAAFREVRRAWSLGYSNAGAQLPLELGVWLEREGRHGDAAGLYRAYLSLRYPRFPRFDPSSRLRSYYSPPDQRIVFRLPMVELRSGQPELAIRTASHLLRQLPREHPASEARAAALRRFIADVERGRGDRWSEKTWIGPELRAG